MKQGQGDMLSPVAGPLSVEPASRSQWRAWLADKGDDPGGVWLVLRKGPLVPLTYPEAVEEALAAGWIDSKANKLDVERWKVWMAPRRRGSVWSQTNKERVARLTAEGLMTPRGLAVVKRAQADGSWETLDEVTSLEVPSDLQEALDADAVAANFFARFPSASKRIILEWIRQAKSSETRRRRVEETVALAARDIRAHQGGRPKKADRGLGLVLRLPRPDEEAEFYRAHRATSPGYPSFLHCYEEGMPFTRYLEVLAEREAGIGLPPDQVPATFLFAFAGERIVGRVSIRHHLDPRLVRVGGHIGYVVVPESRRRGYGTAMLRRSLEIARERLGLLSVLVTCDVDNLASRRTIEMCGGVLENVYAGPATETPTCRYWLDTTLSGARESQTGGMSQVGRFLATLLNWVAERPDVVSVGLVGSYARGEARPGSDVDVMILTSGPDSYVADPHWAADLGEVTDLRVERYGRATSVRVWYVGGLEVEYGLASEDWAALPLDEGTRQVAAGGLRVLFERAPSLSRLLLSDRPGERRMTLF